MVRVEYEGAIYHVTVRGGGDNRRNRCVDNRDRSRFLKRVGDCAEECEVRVLAFCLMSSQVRAGFVR